VTAAVPRGIDAAGRARGRRDALRLPLAFLLAVLAAACATVPPPAAREGEFSVVGRVAVRYGDESATGRVTWRHSEFDDDLLIASPLGQGIAEITRRDGTYTLVTANGRRFDAADPERLTEQALGWALPLAGLPDWLQGRPQAGVAADARYDGKQLAELRQQGWTIEYLGYEEAGRLPRRLRLTRGDLDIRLVIEEWPIAPK
jgi:outer membrane lipoprotein LolB